VFIAIGLTPLIYLCHALVERKLGIPPQPHTDEPEVAPLTSA
jgi:hypothetical protein